MMMGPGPAVNQLPTPRATLKVSNIPSFVTGDDFSRLMLQLEGCVDARLLGRQPGGDQVGYGEFSDKMNASKAKNLYHGWTGWGGRGLAIELTDFSMAQLMQQAGPGQKRMRDGDDLLQPGNNYKQARPDMPAMGMGSSMGGGMQPGMQQSAPQQDVGGLLQNLSNVTSLLQQQGIAQQLLAAAQQVGSGGGMAQPQQQGPGMMGQGGQQPLGGGSMMGGGGMGQGGGGGYVSEPYNPATVGPGNSLPQQPQQQLGGMMGGGGGGMMPQQQQPMQQFQEPAMQQGGGGYMGGGMGGPSMQQQPMMQAPQQQQYGMGPQAQPQIMQGGMGPGGGMMQPQQPQLMPQQPPQQGMMQPGPQQGMGPGPGPGPSMHRGDVMAPPPVRQYPPDACNTLYIEGLPADVTRRELAHIFRATEGFRSLRLVIKDSKKHAGEKLVMAFAEYTNTYFATEAMDKLQGYPFDLDDPETVNFFIKYARPLAGGRGGPPPPLQRGAPPGLGRGGGAPGPRGPPVHDGGRGGGMFEGRGRGMGGRGGGRFGPGGPPPRESPRRF